jgi:hypothetical protein
MGNGFIFLEGSTYSLHLGKIAILAQCHGLVSEVQSIIDKNTNIYNVK